MDYIIELDQFEGPLDLLLHLIKESNIDIFDINIEEITKQYLEYITKVEQMNLNVASEYLVMAAELIEIKSKILLPKKESDDEEEEEDPREQLIQKLIEYKNYKEVTPSLHELESDRNKFYTKSPSLEINGIDLSPKVSDDIDMNALVSAFNSFLKKKELDKPLNTKVTNKEYSIVKRSVEIKKILKTKKRVKFNELFEFVSKDYIIVTFLSILSMAKSQEISIEQNGNFDEVYVSARM